MGLAAGLWVLDRIVRLAKRIFHGAANYCTLTPLPEGATRVTMRRPIKASPGSHVFLWIPGVRMLESHPFTLLATEPVAEFVIAARDGFTKQLHKAACKAGPDKSFRAGIEGPYGMTPNPREFDKVVLLAGGSGATFTLALALNWAKVSRLRKHRSTLDFVWTIKNKSRSNLGIRLSVPWDMSTNTFQDLFTGLTTSSLSCRTVQQSTSASTLLVTPSSRSPPTRGRSQ